MYHVNGIQYLSWVVSIDSYVSRSDSVMKPAEETCSIVGNLRLTDAAVSKVQQKSSLLAPFLATKV